MRGGGGDILAVMTSRQLAAHALVLAVVLPVTACTATAPGTGAAPAGLARFYDQQLAWGPCEPYARTDADRGAFGDPAYDCAYLSVPLDYAQPGGETARVGVLRKAATGDRIGSLVSNPGGPGASGMSSVATAIGPGVVDTELAERFDVIGFDPRGVGASEPVVDCLTDAEREEDRADDPAVDGTPEGVARAEAESREFVDRCVERVGDDVLATVGTRDVARDVDVLRDALGDEQLTFLGFSYGTLIGARYSAAFPERVRALVLDGAVDPSRDLAERAVGQAAGFQGAFDAFAADCAARPDCPLGTDPAQATARYQELVRPLYDSPAAVGDGRVLGFGDALTGTQQALYVEQLWEVLRVGLARLRDGDGLVLMRLADVYEDRGPDGGYSNLQEAFTAVRCVDERAVTDPAEIAEIERRAAAAAPFRDDGRGPVPARDPCAFWPVPPTSAAEFPEVDGLPQVLVVSTTGDPATPYRAGVDLADALEARLLTVEGDQHLATLRGDGCVDDTVTRYLVDLELPAEAAQCPP